MNFIYLNLYYRLNLLTVDIDTEYYTVTLFVNRNRRWINRRPILSKIIFCFMEKTFLFLYYIFKIFLLEIFSHFKRPVFIEMFRTAPVYFWNGPSQLIDETVLLDVITPWSPSSKKGTYIHLFTKISSSLNALYLWQWIWTKLDAQ